MLKPLTPQMFAQITMTSLKASLEYARAYNQALSLQMEAMEMAPHLPWIIAIMTPAETEMVALLQEARAALVARREELAA